MNTFESSLLTELQEHVVRNADTPPPRPSRAKRLGWAAVPVGAVGAVAVGLVLVQSPATAYAVDKGSNGDVVVTIDKLSDASGLQQALKADGINAIVNYDASLDPSGLTPPPGAVTHQHGAPGPSVSSGTAPGKSLSGNVLPSMSSGSGSGSAGSAPQAGCGAKGPINVTSTPTSVTFTIPTADVGSNATLHITTGGSQTSGLAALQIRWTC